MKATLPGFIGRIGRLAALLYLAFGCVALYAILRSHLILIG